MAELWLGKKGSFTEESDGETAGVLILLAATVCPRWKRLVNPRVGQVGAAFLLLASATRTSSASSTTFKVSTEKIRLMIDFDEHFPVPGV